MMKLQTLPFTVLLLALNWPNLLTQRTPQQDPNGYVSYYPGNMPLILTAPHGGSLQPAGLPTRTQGCMSGSSCIWNYTCGTTSSTCAPTVFKDTRTWEIAEIVSQRIENITGFQPYIITSNLHRQKLDPNREVNEATFGDPTANLTYYYFHDFIDTAQQAVTSSFGKGLLLDFHGQVHSQQWIELGYMISGSNLNNNNVNATTSSIRLVSTNNPSMTFDAILRGQKSLGGYIQAAGWTVVPSPGNLGPFGGGYFSGGYITKVHGSRSGGSIDAIQIELPSLFRSVANHTTMAADLGTVINDFYQENYAPASFALCIVPSPSITISLLVVLLIFLHL